MHPAPPSAPYFNSRPISYPSSERESTFLGPSNEGSNAVWRDIPHHSITSESKTQHVYDSRGASRPTSAPFSSLRSITPQPKYPAHISGGESAKEYTKVGIAENQRPSSAIAESYTRQKFQVDRKNQNHSDRSDGLKYLNVPGSSSDATSIIDRVVNFGRDPPAYLRPKGSRAQSAGHQRALDREAAGRNKQFAMMYAEELIQKLDSVILG
jgi:hypothetical protein